MAIREAVFRVDDFVEGSSPVEDLSRAEYRRELVARLLG